jgi:hypothetical protein
MPRIIKAIDFLGRIVGSFSSGLTAEYELLAAVNSFSLNPPRKPFNRGDAKLSPHGKDRQRGMGQDQGQKRSGQASCQSRGDLQEARPNAEILVDWFQDKEDKEIAEGHPGKDMNSLPELSCEALS